MQRYTHTALTILAVPFGFALLCFAAAMLTLYVSTQVIAEIWRGDLQ